MTNLEKLLKQKADIEEKIKQEREKLQFERDRRLEQWRKDRQIAYQVAVAEAQRTGRNFVYIDDGTEITVTPQGNSFYNMADWY
jgi:LPS O-antigen subunit length determinant protein (WzzB/FepE family)